MKKKNKILVTMKALTLAAAVAVMVVSPSCRKEMAGTQDLVKEGGTIQVNINAGLGDFVAADATKATATPVVRFEWESTDKVDAYYGATKISGDARISVTPSENKIFAKLTGTIDASGHTIGDDDIITFVYSNGCTVENNLTFNFSNQGATIPFVAYATVKWSEIKSGLTDNILEFKFATSVMKIAATNLGGGDITNATIDSIYTKVTLTPQTSGETVAITGSEAGTITKTAGIDASSDGTRAIFTVGLVPDSNTGRSITITITQTDYTNKGVITSTEILSSKSYTTPASLFSCGSLNGHDYVSIAGTKWATQNLAITISGKGAWKGKNSSAVQVPGTTTAVQIGDYFQWGAYEGYCGNGTDSDKGLLIYNSFSIDFTTEASSTFTASFDWKETGGSFDTGYKAPYYDKTTSQYTHYFDEGAGLANKDDAARILWEGTWRMPTTAEFQAMKDATYWAWNDKDCGYYVYAPQEGDAGKINTQSSKTYDKSSALLFFPVAGSGSTTSLSDAGTRGRYWSSTLYSSTNAYFLNFYSIYVDPQNNGRRHLGFSVRPVSD